ncbi:MULTISPECIES: hypothetical protein [Paracoccus]|nr:MULTISPECIES: hypothetical protein [Paracoccus]MCV2449057.1 hypothetical protein [Paracoccus sp. DMF]
MVTQETDHEGNHESNGVAHQRKHAKLDKANRGAQMDKRCCTPGQGEPHDLA